MNHLILCSIFVLFLTIFGVIVLLTMRAMPDLGANGSIILIQSSRHWADSTNQTNFLCNDRESNRLPSSSTRPLNETFDFYRRHTLQPYCDLLPTPPQHWIQPQSYVESDVVFVIFTGAPFYRTRATATHDTWLSRVSNYYFLSGTPYPYLPITVMKNAGEDKLSNMKKLFYGLHRIYQDQMKLPIEQRQKWFYIIGCDTFILPHHLLKRLDNLDYQQPVFLGGHWGRHPCYGPNGTTGIAEFPSGGAGFFFSMKLLEMMDPHLIRYVDDVWPKTSEISDVALACLVKELGVELTKRPGFWAHPPRFTMKENGRERFHAEAEPNDFHYIQPDEMYALDEFYVHQQMDRLIKDEQWSELAAFSRRFVISHYEILRKKRKFEILAKI